MTHSRYAEQLTDQQLGAAFRGALTLNGIMHEIGSGGTPQVGDLLRDVDHEVEKRFPEVVKVRRDREIAIYKDSVNAVFGAVLMQRDRLLERVEEFFEEFRLDSAHDAVQEQLDGATFDEWADDVSTTAMRNDQVLKVFQAVAFAVQTEAVHRGGAK